MDNYNGEISDGYHTFDELYYHRMILFSVICNTYKNKAWKSWKHDNGTMYDDYFIIGISTDEGDFTYHYHKKYWNVFKVKELVKAPVFDGHTSKDIIRLCSLDNKTRLNNAKDLLAIQKENIDDEYMKGLYNGMELIIATLEDREPIYIEKSDY